VSGQRFCYPQLSRNPLRLNVELGPIKTVSDLEVYLNAAFTWALGVAGVISIIFIMIGGLQYAIGAGAQSQVSQGKERIKNAVFGFVLLLLSVLILQTVNPQLLKLQPPQLPLIKRVVLAGGTSCEDMLKDGFTIGFKAKPNIQTTLLIKDNSTSVKIPGCGNIGDIQKDKDGNAIVKGTTCEFRSCPGADLGGGFFAPDTVNTCLGAGALAACVSCQAVVPTNSYHITPSEEACSALNKGDTREAVNGVSLLAHAKRCFYSHEVNLIYDSIDQSTLLALASVQVLPGAGLLAAGAVLSAINESPNDLITGTCSELEFFCKDITTCDDYDTVSVKNARASDDMAGLEGESLFGGSQSLGKLCNEDPCGAAQKEGDNKTKCEFNDNPWPVEDSCN
jgi:hypothetical protein